LKGCGFLCQSAFKIRGFGGGVWRKFDGEREGLNFSKGKYVAEGGKNLSHLWRGEGRGRKCGVGSDPADYFEGLGFSGDSANMRDIWGGGEKNSCVPGTDFRVEKLGEGCKKEGRSSTPAVRDKPESRKVAQCIFRKKRMRKVDGGSGDTCKRG